MAYREASEDIVLSVRQLHIPKEELIVVGGAALELYGIRDSYTIDVVVSPERMTEILYEADNISKTATHRLGHVGLMAQVRSIGSGRKLRGYPGMNGDVTYMPAPNDHLYWATFDELRDEAIDASDVLVSPPDRILDWKRSVNRMEDRDDIVLLENYLSTHVDGEPYVTYGGWEPGENPEIISMRKAAFEGALDKTKKSPTFKNAVHSAVERMNIANA